MRQRVVTSFFLVSIFFGGCSQSGSRASSGADATTDASIPASLDGQSLPIEAVLVVNSGAADALHSAVDALTARCMTQHGLTYVAYPEDRIRSNPFDLVTRYGHISIGSASEFGYHSPQASVLQAFDKSIAEIDTRRERISSVYNDLLYGSTRADGCYSAAVKDIYGQSNGASGMGGYQQLVDLQATGSQKALGERAVVDAMKSWSTCMASVGYTYPTIYAAKGPFPSSETDRTPPSTEERKQAVADARCRSESKVELILFATESRIETDLLDLNTELVTNFKKQMDDAVTRAQRLVSGRASPTTNT